MLSRTLHLGSKGADVSAVQEILAGKNILHYEFYTGQIDGDAGHLTTHAFQEAKFYLGYDVHDAAYGPFCGALLVGYLTGAKKRDKLMLARAKSRHLPFVPKPKPTPETADLLARQRYLHFLKWGVDNNPLIDWAELRPIPLYKVGQLPPLPMKGARKTDCSGFVTLGHRFAGLPNPNRKDGKWVTPVEGYTGTLLDTLEHIPLSAVKPGDLIVYGPGTGSHVASVYSVANRENPLTVSHGWDGEPAFVYVNSDGRQPQTYLRLRTHL